MKRRFAILAGLFGAARLSAQSRTRLLNVQMPAGIGPGLRGLDAGGGERVFAIDPSLEITSGNVVRVNPASVQPLRSDVVFIPLVGGTITLPNPPAPNTKPWVACAGMVQIPGTSFDYTLSGSVLTPTTAGLPVWQAAGGTTVLYFF